MNSNLYLVLKLQTLCNTQKTCFCLNEQKVAISFFLIAKKKHIMVDLDSSYSMDNCFNEASGENVQALPSNCMPLVHQVAGHFFGKGRTKLGLFKF